VACANWTFATANISCRESVGVNLIVSGTTTINTTNGTLGSAVTQLDGSPAWLVIADTVQVSGIVTVSGTRPLIIIVHGSAAISGIFHIDTTGAGTVATCGASAGVNGSDVGAEGSGGGGGGGGTAGGAGGASNDGAGQAGGIAGAAQPA